MDNSISFHHHTRRNRCHSLSMATTATTSFIVRPHSARRSPTQLYGAHPTQINSNNRRDQHPPSRMENQHSCRWNRENWALSTWCSVQSYCRSRRFLWQPRIVYVQRMWQTLVFDYRPNGCLHHHPQKQNANRRKYTRQQRFQRHCRSTRAKLAIISFYSKCFFFLKQMELWWQNVIGWDMSQNSQ